MGAPLSLMGPVRLLAGFIVIWLVLDGSARMLGSFRGEGGVLVALLVLLAAAGVEFVLFGLRPLAALRAIGLGPATGGSLVAALLVGGLLLCFFPVFALIAGVPMSLRPDWYWLLPGLFAQGGIAEEALFRGYLFRRLRAGLAFWPAALAAALPFIAVHLLLFATLDFAIAVASLALSVSIAFPLAWLFERAGNSLWPPAILHFVIQGAIKLVDVPEPAVPVMAISWIGIAAAAPWLLFALLRPR